VRIPVPPRATSCLFFKLLGGVRLGSFWWFPPHELHEFRHLLGAEAEAHTEYGVVPELI
ncbi:MAG: hypothetical protein HC767_04980, partial [Akkermansiaceae bacterium]|nr:hypothetical protein [Akkermansiaceae bacterium]